MVGPLHSFPLTACRSEGTGGRVDAGIVAGAPFPRHAPENACRDLQLDVRQESSTVIDSQFSANRYHEGDRWLGAAQYRPSDVGPPAYMDERCGAQAACSLPVVQMSGYTTIGSTNPNWFHETTNVQGAFNVTLERFQF